MKRPISLAAKIRFRRIYSRYVEFASANEENNQSVPYSERRWSAITTPLASKTEQGMSRA